MPFGDDGRGATVALGNISARASATELATLAMIRAAVNIGTQTYFTGNASAAMQNSLRVVGGAPAYFELFLDVHGRLSVSVEEALRSSSSLVISSTRGLASNPNAVFAQEVGNFRSGPSYVPFSNNVVDGPISVLGSRLEPNEFQRYLLSVRIPYLGNGMLISMALTSTASMDGRCVVAPVISGCVEGTDNGVRGEALSDFISTIRIAGAQMLDAGGNLDVIATQQFEFASPAIYRGNPFAVSTVPEPSTVSLVGSALLLLAYATRRRRANGHASSRCED